MQAREDGKPIAFNWRGMMCSVRWSGHRSSTRRMRRLRAEMPPSPHASVTLPVSSSKASSAPRGFRLP